MPEGGTPDTLAYMVLGYAATAGIMLGLIVFMWLKARRLRQEAEMLQSLAEEDRSESRESEP